MGRVEGKVAIVVGAASGIGRAAARTLSYEGAAVVLRDLDLDGARDVADELVAGDGRAVAHPVDVGHEPAVRALIEHAVTVFGGLDILFNNVSDTSSVAMLNDRPIHEMSVEWWDNAMRIDLRGAMLGCKYAIPRMLERGGGSIVSTSSNQGLAGDLTQAAYSCAKAAIVQLMRSVATQYGRYGIRANTVSPGAIHTPAFDRLCPPAVIAELAKHSLIERIGEPEDVANAVLFLASDESAYVTGHVIPVDGGQLAHLPTYAYMRANELTSTYEE
jgi:NAD(P)-dependent dehydrogenase (short-subunit alcohol dehydrogenase family)